ncbi:nucleoside triphosphate pyrophosphohydrolase family protein [Mycolicibacterium palauense]|uniref:nucleoside triphosphate pyrophosphohydrolase family protein n=1 Tax=Mycolicibacterium palauense TaxID=2034511 RepID=UPI001C3F421E|nr:nucleoside triphosphate pyrophosphohydrolase family protein [Mycolicibacterium palauense]
MDEYQKRAFGTAIYPGAGDADSYTGLSYVAMGLAGEGGEVAGKVKKILRDDDGIIGDVARAKIADELGDVLWYVALLATQLGVSLESIASRNLAKLYDRKDRGVIQGSGDER